MADEGVPLCAAITLNIESGQQNVLVRPVRGLLTQRVNFVDTMVRGSFNTSTNRILVSKEIKKNHPVIVLFPNYKDRDDGDMHIVKSSSFYSRDSFNRVLNQRFQDSLEHTEEAQDVRMAVCYGNHVVICEGMTGTPYILWADYLRSEGSSARTVLRDVPFIVNCNGLGVVKCIYRLVKDIHSPQDLLRMPITKKSPEILWYRDSMPFVNETRPERPAQLQLRTMSYRNTIAMMTDRSVQTQSEIDYHTREFTTDNEVMDDVTGFVVGDSSRIGTDDGLMTGDPMQINNMVLAHLQDPTTTPPILASADEYDQGADPFKN